MTTNITLLRGYTSLFENPTNTTALIICKDFQKKLLYQLSKVKPLLFAEAVAEAQAKAYVDSKGPHFCLISADEVRNGQLGQTITDPEFVLDDSMNFEINTMVQPMFLESHMTINVVIIRVKTS